MSNPNLNLSNLDARYASPSQVDSKIANQAATEMAVYNLGSVASGSIDLSACSYGGFVSLTLTANLTAITLPTTTASRAVIIEVVITQDATGSRTITYPAGVKSSEGNPPLLSVAPGAIDTVAFVWDGTRWKVRLVERSLA